MVLMGSALSLHLMIFLRSCSAPFVGKMFAFEPSPSLTALWLEVVNCLKAFLSPRAPVVGIDADVALLSSSLEFKIFRLSFYCSCCAWIHSAG